MIAYEVKNRGTRNVNILGLNVCGLNSKINLGVLEDYIRDYDIACLCETKTDYRV